MSKGANHNSGAVKAAVSAAGSRAYAGDAPPTIRRHVRHIYVHIPFCARICPYCAFYKDLLDRSQISRFCEALLRELELNESRRRTGDRCSLVLVELAQERLTKSRGLRAIQQIFVKRAIRTNPCAEGDVNVDVANVPPYGGRRVACMGP